MVTTAWQFILELGPYSYEDFTHLSRLYEKEIQDCLTNICSFHPLLPSNVTVHNTGIILYVGFPNQEEYGSTLPDMNGIEFPKH